MRNILGLGESQSSFVCFILLAFCQLQQIPKRGTFLVHTVKCPEIKKFLKNDVVVRDLVPFEIWFMENSCYAGCTSFHGFNIYSDKKQTKS